MPLKYNWDEHNQGHIVRHRIAPHEVEEVLENTPLLQIETTVSANGEERVLELGRTNAGRILFVVWTARGGFTRPVTAYDANRKARAEYERRSQ